MPENTSELRLLTFDEFRRRLADVFDTAVDSLHGETSFLEDLGFDSLRMLQLALVFEDLAGEMPAEMAWSIRTVGEAYAYYAERFQEEMNAGDQASKRAELH